MLETTPAIEAVTPTSCSAASTTPRSSRTSRSSIERVIRSCPSSDAASTPARASPVSARSASRFALPSRLGSGSRWSYPAIP